MRAPLKLMPPWSAERLARIRQIERDFHVRAFGEELARINLDLAKEDRIRYLEWMRTTARAHGAAGASDRESDEPICGRR